MPHAKIDTAFIRDHFAAVPDKSRAAAIALYLELALTSAEMLLDGDVPQHVAVVCAHKIGISRSRYGRSEVSKLVRSMASADVVEELQDGTLRLRYWEDHHNSRAYVDDRRKADTERKRGKRAQPPLPGLGANVRSGHAMDSAADGGADLARGGARTRSASESASTSSSDLETQPATPDDDLRLRLEHLGVNGHALTSAIHEPERANAWIDYTRQHANGNPAGYFATSFAAGEWPPATTAQIVETHDYAERAHKLYQRTQDADTVADWLAGLTRLSVSEREHILAAVTDDEPDLP